MLMFVYKLSLHQVACATTFIFFYAVLVIWPSQEELLQMQLSNITFPYSKRNLIGKRNYRGHIDITPNINFTHSFKQMAQIIIRLTNEPVIVWWTNNFPWIEDRFCGDGITCKIISSPLQIESGAYLFEADSTNFSNLPLPRRAESLIWGLVHDESSKFTPELMHEKALNLFNFSSTYSRYSNVPFPLFHAASVKRITNKAYYFVETAKKNFYISKGLAPVLYIQSNCDTSNQRDEYVRELMKYIKVDSYGTCLNNKRFPDFQLKSSHFESFDNDKILKFLAKYKFTIAIENSVCNDYMTEKLWRPIKIGSVPIYFGSPTVRDWLPNNKSAILLEDYRTPKALSEHLKKLLEDDKLYEEYLEHKTKGIITNQRLINELKLRPHQNNCYTMKKTFECFICEKLHSMKIKAEVNIVNKSHFDCPKPISALSLGVNPLNKWVHKWETVKTQVGVIYNRVIDTK